MRRAIILSGVTFTEPNLPTIAVDATSLAIAALPGLKAWVSPESAFKSGLTITDRVGDFDFTVNGTSFSNAGLINGHPAFSSSGTWLLQGQQALLDMAGGYKYTKVAVIKLNAAASLMGVFGSTPVGAADHYVGVIPNTRVVQIGHNGATSPATLSTAAGASIADAVKLLMVTYDSTAALAKVYLDDVLIGSGTLNPSAVPTVNIGAFRPGTFPFGGLIAECMLFNDDYSAANRTADKVKLVSYLKTKYGIV